jgi:DNA-binding transcriptional LysR family regulator
MEWIDRIGRRLKLHDLHIFMTVAEMGSMGKAAERLALSQPSVSKAIANIEHAIGVPLFDRTLKPRPMVARCSDGAVRHSLS